MCSCIDFFPQSKHTVLQELWLLTGRGKQLMYYSSWEFCILFFYQTLCFNLAKREAAHLRIFTYNAFGLSCASSNVSQFSWKERAHKKVQWFCPGLELIFQVSSWPPVANHSDPFSQSEAQLLHGQWTRSVCVYLCGSKVPWLTAQRYSVTQAALQECSSAQGWVVEPH